MSRIQYLIVLMEEMAGAAYHHGTQEQSDDYSAIATLLRAGQKIRSGITCEEDEFEIFIGDDVVEGCEAWDATVKEYDND